MTTPFGPAAGEWQLLLPEEARELLGTIPVRWWIAGGWALDLFIGRQTRPHKDFDIGILRRDVPAFLFAMPEWDFFEARGGVLYGPLARDATREANSLWGRRARTDKWTLQVLLDDSHEDQWVFRRDLRIRRPLDTLLRYNPDRIPYLVPEIQLLYKARHLRSQDRQDFGSVADRLDNAARQWLCSALLLVDPQHPWLPALQLTV